MDILEIKNVAYSYANSKEKVLSGVNQKFELGKFYAIVGKSGTGKSTLLSLLAGLDKAKTGKILFKNEDIQKKGYSNHRKNNISLVFQNYNLIDYENAVKIEPAHRTSRATALESKSHPEIGWLKPII